MNDYIKRSDLAAIISDLLVSPWAARRMSDVALGIREALCLVQDIVNDEVQNDALKLPAADVAEVVRCRNCINFDPDWGGADWGFCYEVMKQPVDVDFFCAAGERKEGEGMTKVYEEICAGCIDEKWCHDNAAVCDDYLELVELIAIVEEKKEEKKDE